MGRPRKCETKWCRAKAIADGLCSVCVAVVKSSMALNGKAKYVYHCMMCSAEKDIDMMPSQRDMVIASGRLKCFACGSLGAMLTDARQMGLSYKRGPEYVPFKKAAGF
jgi:hypothetical protein